MVLAMVEFETNMVNEPPVLTKTSLWTCGYTLFNLVARP